MERAVVFGLQRVNDDLPFATGKYFRFEFYAIELSSAIAVAEIDQLRYHIPTK
jgi:hypothetical protein